MGRTRKTEGIILKRSNFGEADRILTVYTKHYGKIKILAKGVRKISSRRGGIIEIFNHVILFLYQGKNFDLLTEAEVKNTYQSWRKNLKKVGLAYYFCEIVDKLTPEEQPHQRVFESLKDSLNKIETDYGLDLVRDFEEFLLKELGFGVPQAYRAREKSLRDYIEQVTEKKINAPKLLVNLRR